MSSTALAIVGACAGALVAFALIYLASLRRLRKVTGRSMRRQLAEDLHIHKGGQDGR